MKHVAPKAEPKLAASEWRTLIRNARGKADVPQMDVESISRERLANTARVADSRHKAWRQAVADGLHTYLPDAKANGAWDVVAKLHTRKGREASAPTGWMDANDREWPIARMGGRRVRTYRPCRIHPDRDAETCQCAIHSPGAMLTDSEREARAKREARELNDTRQWMEAKIVFLASAMADADGSRVCPFCDARIAPAELVDVKGTHTVTSLTYRGRRNLRPDAYVKHVIDCVDTIENELTDTRPADSPVKVRFEPPVDAKIAFARRMEHAPEEGLFTND